MVELVTANKYNTEGDDKLIRQAYRDLLHSIKANMDDHDRAMIRQAFELAVDAHKEQRRKSGEPYILHPIAVAKISAEEIGLGPTAIVCALLHDVVEDTKVTLEEIREQFGDRVAKIVDGLTKLDSAYNVGNPQAENFKKVLSTLIEDVRVVLIKMADRLHNMRTISAKPLDKQLKTAAETSFIYAPLAHRLGLYNFKTEFLDLCMKIRDPEGYHEIARLLNATKKSRNEYIEEFILPISEKMDEMGLAYRIFGRPKSIFSIYKKMKKKNVPFEEIYDLFAVRIILDVPYDDEKIACWKVYSVITDIYQPIPERLKDWIAVPKSNGYESLHTTVIGPKGRYVEVQVRTTRMDEIAERGFAAHWKYKGITNQPDVYERWLDGVREILEDPTTDAVQFLGEFKSHNLFQEEVFVYTPKGDMKVLPKGSTALDFAFSIHSDIGYHCYAIKVENRLVPMSYTLQNGDQVEIITNPNQRPTEDWLDMVNTSRAKSKIRSSMKEEKRKEGLIAEEAVERKLKNLKVNSIEDSVAFLTKYYNYDSYADFFYDIAKDKLTISEIFKKFKEEEGVLVAKQLEKELVKVPEKEKPGPPRNKKKKGEGVSKLLINGEPAEKYSHIFASCCNPVQGDSVFAYLTVDAQLKIHRSNCPNATNLMANYSYRVMKAEWINTTNSSFVADLKITGIDDGVGVIQKITQQISDALGLNIRSFAISGKDGYFEAKISLFVSNKDQLNLAIKSLRKLSNVTNVERQGG